MSKPNLQYTLRVTRKFDSAHKLNHYDGPCANLHGHTWKYEVYILVPKLIDKVEFGIDFKDVKKTMDEHVTDKFDHHYLNDIIAQPTAENLATFIFTTLAKVFKEMYNADVIRVDLWETENACVTITPTK